MSLIKAVFFDLDGTISDPREGIVRCLRWALDELGYPIPLEEQLLRYIGPPLYEGFATLLDSNDIELVERAIRLYRGRFVAQGMFENSVYPGIVEALASLRADGHRLYVVTTKPTVFAQKILNHFGLTANFHRVYGSELDGTRTDKRDLIAHVLEQEHIHPADAVMVGDREHDIKGALANGVFPIAVLWGYGSRTELINAGATILCESPQSLVGHFQKRIDTEAPN